MVLCGLGREVWAVVRVDCAGRCLRMRLCVRAFWQRRSRVRVSPTCCCPFLCPQLCRLSACAACRHSPCSAPSAQPVQCVAAGLSRFSEAHFLSHTQSPKCCVVTCPACVLPVCIVLALLSMVIVWLVQSVLTVIASLICICSTCVV